MSLPIYDRIRTLQDLQSLGSTALPAKSPVDPDCGVGYIVSPPFQPLLSARRVEVASGPAAALRALRALQAQGVTRIGVLSQGYAIRDDIATMGSVLLDQAIIDDSVSRKLGSTEFFTHPSFTLNRVILEKSDELVEGCSWTLDAEEFATLEKLAFMRQKQIQCVDFLAAPLFVATRKTALKLSCWVHCAGRLSESGFVRSSSEKEMQDSSRKLVEQALGL